MFTTFPLNPQGLIGGMTFGLETWRKVRKAAVLHRHSDIFDGEDGFFMMSDMVKLDPPVEISQRALLPTVDGWHSVYDEYHLTIKYLDFLGFDRSELSDTLDDVMSYFPRSSGIPGKQWPLKVIRAALNKNHLVTPSVEQSLRKSVQQKKEDMLNDLDDPSDM